jgi:hypothetical protein
MVKPRRLPENVSVWPSGGKWFSRAGAAGQAVTLSSPSPFWVRLEGVVLRGEYGGV